MRIETVLIIYLAGLLLTGWWAYRAYWNKKALLPPAQVAARRIACIFVSLFWFAFFPKAIVGVALKALVKG